MSGIKAKEVAELEAEAMRHMHKGLAPSQISRAMGVSEDVAHDLVVMHWKRDKGAKE